jgi:AcrR family transcriptional regulator
MNKSTGVYIGHPAGSAPLEKRKRNGQATKEAILVAALRAFCEHGYDGVGLREIASSAGVTAVLVNRYYGTKENLFSAVVDVAFGSDNPFTGDVTTLASRLGKLLVDKTYRRNDSPDGLLLLLRSAANPGAAEILKRAIEKSFATPLHSVLEGENAELRAALVLAQIAGFQLMSQVIQIDALNNAGARRLSTLLIRMFDHQLRVGN